MSKIKTVYVCRECGHDCAKWYGKCPGCGAWNSLEEERVNSKVSKGIREQGEASAKPQPISEVNTSELERSVTGIGELDLVLGGGIVPGSLVLVGGEPGIGKSTLLMQAAYAIGKKYDKVLYVSGEESAHQVKMRAERLDALSSQVLLLAETNMEHIIHYAKQIKPVLLILDSIQTVYLPELSSAPGSVSQVRQCTADLMHFAKNNNVAVILAGHVTKEGTLAGPRVLEHMVDTVLYFEGERNYSFRLLRAAKNRFGSTNEIGIFEMQHKGLIPFASPSQVFLNQRPPGVAGSVVVPAMQGTRPVMLEVQALASSTSFGNPRRLTTGVDYNRVLLILAVLDKRVGIHVGNQDIYVNLAGGVKIEDPGLDLAIATAVASSFRDMEVDNQTVMVGEIGLSGEVRAIGNVDRRLKEALKMGFTKAIIPKANAVNITEDMGLTIIGVSSLAEALEILIGR